VASPPTPTAPAAPTPRAAAPVPAPTGDVRERPWGAEPDAPKSPPPTVAVAPTPTAVAAARPAPAPPPPPPPSIPRAVVEEPPRPPSRIPPGAPRLRVSFLVYSSAPERRSVALTFDGGSLTTLHEGDEANGVAVVRINPDRVDLRYEGVEFTLEVR